MNVKIKAIRFSLIMLILLVLVGCNTFEHHTTEAYTPQQAQTSDGQGGLQGYAHSESTDSCNTHYIPAYQPNNQSNFGSALTRSIVGAFAESLVEVAIEALIEAAFSL